MPLNWDASSLPNMPWENQSEAERNKTANLAWVCMAVGYSSITESNWEDFWARYAFYARLNGELGNYDAIDIYLRIGFTTNCSNEPEAKWYKRKYEQYASEQRDWASRQEQRFHEGETINA